MFENLSERLDGVMGKLRGKGRLTEENIQEALRQVRMALLEADVALPVVKEMIAALREQALGAEFARSLTPGQAFIKLVNDELTRVMGEANESLNLKTQPPAVVLMAGLQGAGKTTTAAKLALYLTQKLNKKVMLVSADIYRPAAILQLERLAGQVGATFLPSSVKEKAADIARRSVAEGKRQSMDVVIVDTAGRLHIDGDMMSEVQKVHAACDPIETLFVVDAMAGQDAVIAARAFDEALPLTGVILTKTDGDARGGAALSVRHVTGKPIKFLGSGEKIEALEPFHPERLAGRILGMGDVVGLVEEVQEKVDQDEAAQLAKKLKTGKAFDYNDLRTQLNQMLDMGGMAAMLDKLPGMGKLPAKAAAGVDDRALRHQIALINSMTPRERKFPKLINGSRKRRIANGAGLQVQDLNRLMKQQLQMQKMMKKMSKGGMKGMMRALQGRMPPGMGRR
ncbi:MAG: signal recognition particle protein [Gammaproteobacteria bacterium]|nr:signal recognition particle protein [Gammaproteobacteria bacterium]